MRRVQLETACPLEFDGKSLTLTRLEPVRWVPWVDGDVEANFVYLSLIQCDFSDDDVTSYLAPWCHQSNNAVCQVRRGETGRALVHFDNRFGKPITSTELDRSSGGAWLLQCDVDDDDDKVMLMMAVI